MKVFAHTKENRPESEWEPLADHSERVAERTEEFCSGFAQGYGKALGMLHDAGKYQADFQAYLRKNSEAYDESPSANNRVPHSIVGAVWACENRPDLCFLLGLPVAAHHGSLQDRNRLRAKIQQSGRRLDAAIQGGLPSDLVKQAMPVIPPRWANDPNAAALGVRMLFSALVDADMLESEAWEAGKPRPMAYAPLPKLLQALEDAIRNKREADQAKAGRAGELAQLRASVSDACFEAAKYETGRYRLTVPTGGGKTLSGLRFALRHAVLHGRSRVIVVIPYTSILEQTVQVYRSILDSVDPCAVIEHHSSLDPTSESQPHRWACENWDASIIVTTSVQFFETLYANHKRPCRKLHRVASSVVLLDEVQTFPLELLDPLQRALTNLTTYFGASVVSMTATQPLIQNEGTEREIVPGKAELYATMRDRYRIEWLGDPAHAVEWEAVAARARHEDRVLVIVHSRKDAELLARMLGPESIHLSARMCAAHRLAVIEEIKARLSRPGPCRAVATQLVEAGVDIDFPVVIRAFAGLETLAQAAGRCNREFASIPGRFVIFRAQTEPPAGSLRAGLNAALQFYHEGRFDLSDPAVFPAYTARVLQTCPTDFGNVLASERALDFEASARNFKMIDDSGVTVIVPYGEAWDRVQRLRRDGPTRAGLRSVERFTVSVYEQELNRLRADGLAERLFHVHGDEREMPSSESVWVVRGDSYPCPYSDRFGLSWNMIGEEPSTLIA